MLAVSAADRRQPDSVSERQRHVRNTAIDVSAGSAEASPADWDAYLASCPRGQFQQTSGWAQVKAREGWSAVREWQGPEELASGGFQLLWKESRFGRLGYVSKGPVVPEETEAAVNAALARVLAAARRVGLAALIVQPPDASAISSDALVRHGFFDLPIETVTRATALISLEGQAEAVVSRFSRSTRQHWRTARRRGMALTWGTRTDLSSFFGLMCQSAKHQHEDPNPARLDLLEALWDAFATSMWLAFAEYNGERLAGLLIMRQRDHLVFWKRGWDPARPELSASHFLMAECLIWASSLGYRFADVVAMSPEIARKVLANETLSEEQSRSRDVFHLRLGACPRLLPPAQLLVVNPALRFVAYPLLRSGRLRSVVETRVR